jgi:CheY-like chemotaxis protein
LLIVDDDTAQVQLLKALLHELGLAHRCHHALSGDIALAFLNRAPPYQNAPRPHLILLDLNMPGMDGCEVLHRIKGDPKFLTIPVIVLSNSQSSQDVDACYNGHANAYLVKPGNLDAALAMVQSIDRFWCGTAQVCPQMNALEAE